jgi:CHAT domain-containing protein
MKDGIRQGKLTLLALLFFIFTTPPVFAQFFEICQNCSVAELMQNIRAHSEHVVRLDYKFDHIHYLQGQLPPYFKPAILNDVLGFLDELSEKGHRKAAILFYAYSGSRLCTWLMPPSNSQIKKYITTIKEEDFNSIRPRLMSALRSLNKVNKKLPKSRQVTLADESLSGENVNKVLVEISNWLLPKPISDALIAEKIDTLVVVPISNIGTVPFAALPLGDRRLVDHMSVVVAPNFQVFKEKPIESQHQFSNPIIAGDPEVFIEDPNWTFEALPGARAEAKEVADFLKSQALIGREASKESITKKLTNKPKDIGLIFLSTHGISDSIDPLDKSFLILSDGRWTAREMSQLKLYESRPLVVMSACQTGLGKNFDVGTIGMARAWQNAGASSVIMSLWNVDDAATRDFMVTFIRLAKQEPTDKALQHAMLLTSKKNADPTLWSGFSIFGAPGLR